jgi:hypothetical protein
MRLPIDGRTLMLAKPMLFLSSYSPLFLMLYVRFLGLGRQLIFLTLGLLGIAALLVLLLRNRSVQADGRVPTEVRSAGPEAATYLASYLLPFLTISKPSWLDLIAFAGFLAVAYLVNAQSSLLLVNPTLFFLRYKIFRITDSNKCSVYVLSRKPVVAGEKIMATRFNNDVAVVR